MTNQQLKAHCEDVIANPQDHLDWVVDMARVALSSLEAVPVAYSYRYAGCETCEGFQDWRDELSTEHPPEWMLETGKVENLRNLYPAPPVPELKLPEKVSCDGFNPKEWGEARSLGQCEGWNACIYDFKRLNGVTS